MKKLIILTGIAYAICLIFACGANSNNQATETDSLGFTQDSIEQFLLEGKKYGVKSGIITFEASGSDYHQGSKDILYFDDFGAKEVVEGYSKGKLTLKAINNGDGFIYDIFYEENKCNKSKSEGRQGIAVQFNISASEWSDFKKEEYKFKRLADVVILGKTCQSYTSDFMDIQKKFTGWQGILFIKETRFKSMDGDSIIEIDKAVKFDENVEIHAAVWEIPKGIKVIEN
jgi:hypothetical protein